MKYFLVFAILFLVLSLIFETTIINFPLTFFICAAGLVLYKRLPTYFMVFILSFIIDSLRVSEFGITALFLALCAGLTLLYERFSGSSDIVIAGLVVAVAGFIYTQILSYSTALTVGFYLLIVVVLILFRELKRRGRISL